MFTTSCLKQQDLFRGEHLGYDNHLLDISENDNLIYNIFIYIIYNIYKYIYIVCNKRVFLTQYERLNNEQYTYLIEADGMLSFIHSSSFWFTTF